MEIFWKLGCQNISPVLSNRKSRHTEKSCKRTTENISYKKIYIFYNSMLLGLFSLESGYLAWKNEPERYALERELYFIDLLLH